MARTHSTNHNRKHFRIIPLLAMAVLLLAGCAPAGGMMDVNYAEIPAGMAYADGEEIYFMHTEVSDAGVAELLTQMMDSPVLEVPALAEVPLEALAQVYVFDNGIPGMGPLGFQPDVFDAPPGTPGYSPLRQLNIVSWLEPGAARLLRSAQEVLAAESAGEVTIEQPSVVINMPFVTWQGGKR